MKETYKSVFTVTLANRTLQLTWEGAGFICLVFGVGLAAINTGNNLLYLILAMCCSFLAVSGILSEMTLRDVSLDPSLQSSLYAKEPYPLSLALTNHKKKIPSYSLRIKFPPDRKHSYQVDRELYIFNINPGETTEKNIMLTANQRGALRIDSCRLSTSFPFGFFLKSKEIPLDIDAVVFPAIRKVELPVPSGAADEGEGILQARGEELFALREYRSGDSMGTVHWKSSAKTGELRVKEFLSGTHQSYTIFLNLTDPQTNRQINKELLEKRVSESASLVYHLVRRGDEVRLKTDDYETAFGNSEAHLETIMRYLAFVGLPREA